MREIEPRLVDQRLRLLHQRMILGADVGIAAQGRERVGDLLLGRGDPLACHVERVTRGVERRLRGDMLGQKLLLAVELALLIGQRVLRLLQIGKLLPVGRAQPVDLQLHRRELRLGMVERDLVVAVVELDQQLAGLDRLVVGHRDRDDAAADIGADRDHVGLGEGVVGLGIAARGEIPVGRDGDEQHRHRQHQHDAQPPAAQALIEDVGSAHHHLASAATAGAGSGAGAGAAARSIRLPRTWCSMSRSRSRSSSARPTSASMRTS